MSLKERLFLITIHSSNTREKESGINSYEIIAFNSLYCTYGLLSITANIINHMSILLTPKVMKKIKNYLDEHKEEETKETKLLQEIYDEAIVVNN